MIALPLVELAGLGDLVAAPGAAVATGLTTDSRAVAPGDLFVAVGGGVAFVEQARAAGAAATLVADDPQAALAAVGRAIMARSRARVVGVTGSNGKTSTKDILGALCAAAAPTVATQGNFNNEIGLPLTIGRILPETELVVLEMGMRGLGQIAALCSIARPDVAVITSIAPAHLELLGSLAVVAQAKAEIVAALPTGGVAVVPGGVAELEPWLVGGDIEVRRLGPGEAWRIAGLEPCGDGCRAAFVLGDRSLTLNLSYRSQHMLANTLSALAAYDALGLPLERAQAGADTIAFSAWRGDEQPLPGGGLLINDAYNANPGSMRAALEDQAARSQGRRRLAVLGTMAELGLDADMFHLELGRLASELGVDELIAVGGPARAYLVDGPNGAWAPDAAAAIELACELVRPGDCVLVKGSRSVGLEVVADALRAF